MKTSSTPRPERCGAPAHQTLEVSPATFDEIAGNLRQHEACACASLHLDAVELRRGPVPPLMLAVSELQAIFDRVLSLDGGPGAVPDLFAQMARAVEFEVLRRVSTTAR